MQVQGIFKPQPQLYLRLCPGEVVPAATPVEPGDLILTPALTQLAPMDKDTGQQTSRKSEKVSGFCHLHRVDIAIVGEKEREGFQ